MVRIVKKSIPHDPASGKGKRYRYEVGSWIFPTRKMAQDWVRNMKKKGLL